MKKSKRISNKTKNKEKTINRKCTYDLMRIIAIFAVIIIHVSAETWYHHQIDKTWLLNNFINGLVSSWAVPLFVAISGALLLKKDVSYSGVFKKWLPRIMICLIVWHFIYYFYETRTFSINSLIVGIKNLLIGKSYSHLWYLYFVLGLYIILPFLSKLVKSLDKKYLLILIIITTFVGIIIPTVKNITNFDLNQYTNMYIIFSFNALVPYLLLGYYLNEYKIENSKFIIIITFIGIILLILNSLYGNHISVIKNTAITFAYKNSITAMPVVISIFSIINKYCDKVESRIISTLGELTFGVYLIHFLVIKMLTHYHITNNIINPLFGNIIVAILVAIISYLIVYLISKIPYLRKIIGLK